MFTDPRPLDSHLGFRATQRQLAPLQAAVWPDSRARTVPPNLSELCQMTAEGDGQPLAYGTVILRDSFREQGQ